MANQEQVNNNIEALYVLTTAHFLLLGKTESIKQVLHYLAAVSSKVCDDLGVECSGGNFEDLITAANPITESFGNAKTSRNNNSSRFGKFIELSYTVDGYIDGALIRTYLLETVRVTSQMKGERNYHIFYEMFAGLPEEKMRNLKLTSLQDFHYTNQSSECNRYDGVSDLDNFNSLQSAMKRIDLSPSDQDEIFAALAAVLHAGNIRFTHHSSSVSSGDDRASVSSDTLVAFNNVCELLGLDEDTLLGAFTRRALKVAGSVIDKSLNEEQANSARDAFAKCLYDFLFRRMIQCINSSISVENEQTIASFIGLLDIFGFEFFAFNSFEQLCINYANEKLQDHFNFSIFKSEKEVYVEEGLKWTFTDYPDNTERLELFENKQWGIYALCDEQLRIPKPSDEKLASSLYAKCGHHRYFEASRSQQASHEFTVKHFACDVKYSSSGLLEKNRNEVAQEILDCFLLSSKSFVCSLNSSNSAVPSLNSSVPSLKRAASHRSVPMKPAASVGKKTITLASQFSKQLQELVSKIRTTRSHFIRCIKSNNELLPESFDYEMVMTQLRCGGALGAVQVFRAGFPNRMDFKYFVTRYSAFIIVCGINPLTRDFYECATRAKETASESYWRLAAAKLVGVVPVASVILGMIENSAVADDVDVLGGLQLGKTQVFLRAPVFEFLELLHVRTVSAVARRLQRRFVANRLAKRSSGVSSAAALGAVQSLMYFSDFRQRKARKVVASTIFLQRRIRVHLAVCLRRRLIQAVTWLNAIARGFLARVAVWKLRRNNAAKVLQRALLGWIAVHMKTKKLLAIALMQRVWRGTAARMKSAKFRAQKVNVLSASYYCCKRFTFFSLTDRCCK
jgi:myosin-5